MSYLDIATSETFKMGLSDLEILTVVNRLRKSGFQKQLVLYHRDKHEVEYTRGKFCSGLR